MSSIKDHHAPRGGRRSSSIVGVVGIVGIVAALVAVVSAPGAAATEPPFSDGWTTAVHLEHGDVRPGSVVAFEVVVTSTAARDALVDVELYDERRQVAQRYWDAQSFAAGEAKRFTVRWTVSPDISGRLAVKVGVFRPGWGVLYHWNDAALLIDVDDAEARSPSPPPVTSAPRSSRTPEPRPFNLLPTAPTASSTAPESRPPVPPGDGFTAAFETPEDFYDRFEVDVHFRHPPGVDRSATWHGDHDTACQGPTTQRTVSAADESDLFWWCAPRGPGSGHIMTSMGDIDGYTIVSFAPNRSFRDIDRVCWDVNLTDLGPRKWFQVLVLPETAYLANDQRLDYISPPTQTVDDTALPLPSGAFMFQWWAHTFRIYNPAEVFHDWEQFSTSDKARRFEHCMVDNGDGTVTMSQERDSGMYQQTVRGSFPDVGRVIFQDDNYNPLKDGPIAGFTWHWDNIEIS